MPLELQPLEEADFPAQREICWLAFKDDLMGLMYPNGYTQAAREFDEEQRLRDLREDPEKYKCMKVIDTDLPSDPVTGQMVGIAVWKFYLHDRTEEEMEEESKKMQERGFPPDSNEKLLEKFFGEISEYKKKNLGGRAHILLNIIATHPDHHRRGVGALHMKWGNQHADAKGLPCYLEASPKGKGLYEKSGYEVVSGFPFDARDWGHKDELKHVCMLRPPKAMNGQP